MKALRSTASVLSGLALFAALGASPVVVAATADTSTDNSILRICAAADELPYSHRDGSGFENKIASAVAEAMGRKPQFVWLAKPSIYIVRDQLDQRQCDVVMGLDTGDQRVLTTRPYYRTGYAFVQKADAAFDVKAWNSPDIAKVKRIGFIAGTPAETMVRKVGLYEDNFNYMKSLMGFKDRRNQYLRVSPQKMVDDVANGTADIAVHFAPEVARYVKAASTLKLNLIPDDNVREDGEKVVHHFDQSAGVRKDDKELLAAVDDAIVKSAAKIEQILKDEGIPLLPITGKLGNRASSIDGLMGPDFE